MSRITVAMAALGLRQERPIRDLIVETINARGSLTAAAEALNVDPSTLSRWCTRLGIRLCQRAEAA